MTKADPSRRCNNQTHLKTFSYIPKIHDTEPEEFKGKTGNSVVTTGGFIAYFQQWIEQPGRYQ
jgi:hypothetical protein